MLKLWRKGYVTSEEYARIKEANQTFINDLLAEYEQEEMVQQEAVVEEPVQDPEPVKPKKQKKVKTAEQIRERNITWTLILGVSILLITGLIVATSQWDQMGPGVKVFSISFVSLFFLALSYGTGRFLKIKQTAFAFLTLGSLLIPIVIVAIGYFELFGPYLSLFGEGRHLLGLLGTLLPLPLYVRHAFVHQSRFYVWVSFLFASLTVGFALGSLPLTMDAFYFGIMVYNAALLLVYVRYQNHLPLFMKEVPLYAQVNLILSTLLMLFFFESEVFYSFNLLLTASIYMAMVFVSKTKEYQFVFSVMIVYAVYQLVEHSPLHSVDGTIYAMIGFLYLGFAYAFKNHTFIEKVFKYTSGVVSLCAFLYISYESLLLRGEVDSWVLFAAYLIITANYLLLSNLTKNLVFSYMTPLFFFVTLWQLWELTEIGPLVLFLFFGAAAVFLYVGLWTKHRFLMPVQASTFAVAIFVQIGCLTYVLNEMLLGYGALQLFTISILAFFVKKKTEKPDIFMPAIWIHPIALSLSAVLFYESLISWIGRFAFPLHLAVSAIILLGIHLAWRQLKEQELSKASFYIGQITYIFAMLSFFYSPVGESFVRPLVFLVGIGIMLWFVLYDKQSFLWLFVSVTTLAFYLSLIDVLAITSFNAFVNYVLFVPLLLIGAGEFGQRKWADMKPYFYWLGHIIQPLVIGVIWLNQTSSEPIHPFLLVVPLSVYVYSALGSRREWEIKLMLYASLSVGFLMIVTIADYYAVWGLVPEVYAFLAMSVLTAGLWVAVPHSWKKRIEWYIVPLSIIGLFMIINQAAPLLVKELGLIFGYVILILFFIHRRKWSIVAFAPLLLTIDAWEQMTLRLNSDIKILLLVGCVFGLLAAGRKFYRYLVAPKYEVDAYSWTAVVYIGYIFTLTIMDSNVWVRIIPVLLTAMWLFVNAKKWNGKYVDQAFYTLSILSLYVAYLMVIDDKHRLIPDIIQAELQSIPILVVLFFLKRNTWKNNKNVMNHVRMALLLLIAGYLVVDAIQSHTIWDAWIIGGLSLSSMIAGLQLRIKSYFFVGMGVLIFNVMYQTRPYWGNVPWWVYLLIAGLALIGIASYNEWQKQQSDSDKPVERKLKRLWLSFKKWN
nr:hypothetical protein [Halobacillus locisalis]